MGRDGMRAPMRGPLKLAGLIAVIAPLLGACVDCFDGAELEAAYHEGQADARARNQGEFDRGHGQASALTYVDGVADGDREGYEAGYFDGYFGPYGYGGAYEAGYFDGHGAGSFDPSACPSGADAGFVDGENRGFDDGWYAGYDLGFDDGYGDGYYDGGASCGFAPVAAISLEQDETQICRDRGHNQALDRSAFDRGYADGKLDNPDYQAGFWDQYSLAYPLGLGHGELDGQTEGYDDGYQGGFVDGYDAAYFVCYDLAYADGYDAGHGQGWLEGVNLGYDEGYTAGYYDAGQSC